MSVRVPDARPSLFHLARKAIARVKARGGRESLHLCRTRVHEAISSRDRLVILVRDCTPEESDMGGLTARWAFEDDAERYALSIGTDSAVTFAGRLLGSARCFLVLEEDTIVHATWCTTTSAWTRELHAYLSPPRGDAYVYESFTLPEMRGRGVYPLALRALASELHREGVARVWVGVEAGNVASLRAVGKGEFEPVHWIDFGRRWGRVWVASEAADAVESLHITANPAATGPSGG